MDSRPLAEVAADPLVRVLADVYLPRIREKYDPREIRLFGSRVRNDWMDYSDLDVVVVSDRFDESSWPDRVARFARDIDLVDPIQFFCYTPAEFARKMGEIGFIAEAMEEAVDMMALGAAHAPGGGHTAGASPSETRYRR